MTVARPRLTGLAKTTWPALFAQFSSSSLYLLAAAITACAATISPAALRVVGISASHASDPVITSAANNFIFRVWGKVAVIDSNTFSLSDGNAKTVRVNWIGHTFCNGDYVSAQGTLIAGN